MVANGNYVNVVCGVRALHDDDEGIKVTLMCAACNWISLSRLLKVAFMDSLTGAAFCF